MSENNGNNTRAASLLAALGAKEHRVSINETEFEIFELTTLQVAQLIELIEKAAKSGVSVMELLNPTTGANEQYFKNDYWKMAAEAQHFFYALIAFSLGITTDQATEIAAKYLPRLLKEIYAVNADFFTEFGGILSGLSQKVPGMAESLRSTMSSLKIGTV